MDPNTGEIWTEEQIAELASINESMAEELKAQLVQVEGTDETIEILQKRIQQGVLAEKLAKEILSVKPKERPKMAIPKTKKHRG